MKFNDTLSRLGEISRELREQGVTVESLDKAIGELKTHQENIEKIESNIDAIRNEVVEPLQQELAQNKTAGRFSVFGFWVGAIGLVVSVGTILVQTEVGQVVLPSDGIPADASLTEIIRRLRAIETHLLFPSSLQAIEGETFVETGERVEVATIDDQKVYLYLHDVTSWPTGEGLKAGIALFKGTAAIGASSFESGFVRSDGEAGLRPWFLSFCIGVAAGDTIRLGDATIVIVKIESTSAEGRPIGDERTGIVIRVTAEENTSSTGNDRTRHDPD